MFFECLSIIKAIHSPVQVTYSKGILIYLKAPITYCHNRADEYLENVLTYRTAEFYTAIQTDIPYDSAGYDIMNYFR